MREFLRDKHQHLYEVSKAPRAVWPVVQGERGWELVTGVVPLDPGEVNRWLEDHQEGS